MTTRILRLLLIVSFASPVIGVVPDVITGEILVGSWVEHDGDKRLSKTTDVTFRPNGTFSSRIVWRSGSAEARFEWRGKWRVKNGVLIEEVTSSTTPEWPNIGAITRVSVVDVTQKEWRFRTERGEKHTYKRKGGLEA